MTARSLRTAFKAGRYELTPGTVEARSDFQWQRLTEGVTSARIYLNGNLTVEELGKTLGVSAERMSQIVRLGLNYMMKTGWLRPTECCSEDQPRPTRRRT